MLTVTAYWTNGKATKASSSDPAIIAQAIRTIIDSRMVHYSRPFTEDPPAWRLTITSDDPGTRRRVILCSDQQEVLTIGLSGYLSGITPTDTYLAQLNQGVFA